MFTYYYKTKDTVGESCDKQIFRTRENMVCYHCGKKIAADKPAACLVMHDGEVRILHLDCSRITCP